MQLLRQISDGVIAVPPMEYGYLGELASTSIPIITIDQRGKHAESPSIAADAYDVQHLKLAVLTLAPVGKTIVDKEVAAAACGEAAQDALNKYRSREGACLH